MIFAVITIANDLQTKLVVTPKKPRCCWEVERDDIDCKVQCKDC